jgi:hypothetical protein
MVHLQELHLYYNRLTTLPYNVANLTGLILAEHRQQRAEGIARGRRQPARSRASAAG